MMSHMIVSDNVIYSWSDGVLQGFKMAFGAAAAENNQAVQQSLDANKEFDFECGPWSADDSKFILPSGVTFSDAGSMMGGASAGTSAQCSACDSAPADSKERCLVALGCK